MALPCETQGVVVPPSMPASDPELLPLDPELLPPLDPELLPLLDPELLPLLDPELLPLLDPDPLPEDEEESPASTLPLTPLELELEQLTKGPAPKAIAKRPTIDQTVFVRIPPEQRSSVHQVKPTDLRCRKTAQVPAHDRSSVSTRSLFLRKSDFHSRRSHFYSSKSAFHRDLSAVYWRPRVLWLPNRDGCAASRCCGWISAKFLPDQTRVVIS
jgi:hypothetical protein